MRQFCARRLRLLICLHSSNIGALSANTLFPATMDFRPRKIINGKMLLANKDADVSILVNIEDVDGPCLLSGKSTDGIEVRVTTATEERVSARGWMEIIGRPTGPGAIRASEVIVFENQAAGGGSDEVEPFDTNAHNMLVQFLNNKSLDELYLAK